MLCRVHHDGSQLLLSPAEGCYRKERTRNKAHRPSDLNRMLLTLFPRDFFFDRRSEVADCLVLDFAGMHTVRQRRLTNISFAQQQE